MQRRLWPVRLLLLMLFFAPGCASFRPTYPSPEFPEVPVRNALVLVADGAGDFRGASNAVKKAVEDSGVPLTVEPFVWSHGYGRVFADQMDEDYARQEGKRLGAFISMHKHLRPDVPIHVIGHSAGSLVALSAAESATHESIEQLVLLAPSVGETYDLRPCLGRVKGCIHVFYSRRDCFYLKVGRALNNIAHLRAGPAAGSRGFRPWLRTEHDAELYSRLRQYPWEPHLQWTGNEGGHYGAYQQTYLKLFVLPQLCLN